MKNIYIIGVPRTGKTTLSKLIKEKFPIYNQISFESVRNGFIKSQPNLNMGNKFSEARKNILPNFILEFTMWNNIITSNPCLIEGDFINLKELYNKISKNDLIICLGHNKKTIDQIIKNIRKYDTIDDYTFNWEEDKLKEHFKNIMEEDENNFKYCIENQIRYYDTSVNRNDVFKHILNEIINDK